MVRTLRLGMATFLLAGVARCGQETVLVSKGAAKSDNRNGGSGTGTVVSSGQSSGDARAASTVEASGATDSTTNSNAADTNNANSTTTADSSSATNGADTNGNGTPDASAAGQGAAAVTNVAGTTATDPSTTATPTITGSQLSNLCKDPTKVTTVQRQINFPKPASYCAWGQGGNWAFDASKELIVTARREEKKDLGLPAGAIVCAMSFTFPDQYVKYDDEIMLTFNSVMLMSSQDYNRPGEMPADGDGLIQYDWAKLLGKPYPINQRPNYFIEPDCGSNCLLPPTEKRGVAKLQVRDETVRKIAVATQALGKTEFMFVTTGDNNPDKDCMHSAFNFAVNVRYVIKP